MKGRFGILIGLVVLLTGTGLVFAQTNPNDEYDEWQKAAREEQREHREYLKNPKNSNYLDWRSAQRDTQREYEEYKLALDISRNGFPPRPMRSRNVIVVGQAQPVERTVVVAKTNGRYANGTKVAYVNGNGRYVNGTAVAYVNGNVKGRATCGTGTAYLINNGYGDEYDDWAAAEREVLREHQEFLNNPSDDNFAGWKEAQVDACREFAEYRGATTIMYSAPAAVYTEPAVYAAPAVSTTYVRRRAPVRRVRAKRVKRCVCR